MTLPAHSSTSIPTTTSATMTVQLASLITTSALQSALPVTPLALTARPVLQCALPVTQLQLSNISTTEGVWQLVLTPPI